MEDRGCRWRTRNPIQQNQLLLLQNSAALGTSSVNSSPLKLIMSDGFPTRYKEMKRNPSATTLWPDLARIIQRPSSAPQCIFRPSCFFYLLPCTLSPPDIINICIVLTRHTCATEVEVQGRKIMPGMRNFSFSLLPFLLSNYIQVRKTDCWQYH